MRKSSTWLPVNDLTDWDDYSIEQSANWQCVELKNVDTMPCTGDYMMIGRESLSEALFNVFGEDYFKENFNQPEGFLDHFLSVIDGNGNIQSGTFEFMKYKLWKASSESQYSPCHYGRLQIERAMNLAHLTPNIEWPCPVSAYGASRIFGGLKANNGSFPFFVGTVAGRGARQGGVLLSPDYVLAGIGVTVNSVVVYGLQSDQTFTDAFNGPNLSTVTAVIPISDELNILQVTPSIPLGPLVKPAIVTDCSGPSAPTIGKYVAGFGLGSTSPTLNVESMQVKCGIVTNNTEVCENNLGIDDPVCIDIIGCSQDLSSPILTKHGDNYYVVSLIVTTKICECMFIHCFQLIFNFFL